MLRLKRRDGREKQQQISYDLYMHEMNSLMILNGCLPVGDARALLVRSVPSPVGRSIRMALHSDLGSQQLTQTAPDGERGH